MSTLSSHSYNLYPPDLTQMVTGDIPDLRTLSSHSYNLDPPCLTQMVKNDYPPSQFLI